MLGIFSRIVVIGTSIAAGLQMFSFWWVLIPAFFSGSVILANGPHYDGVIAANKRGNLWLFPTQLLIHGAGQLLLAAVAYWITIWVR